MPSTKPDDISPFQIDLKNLKRRNKIESNQDMNVIDTIGENHGFVERTFKKTRGRKPSPRTGQVHAKVLPYVAIDIANEAKRRGVQQGCDN